MSLLCRFQAGGHILGESLWLPPESGLIPRHSNSCDLRNTPRKSRDTFATTNNSGETHFLGLPQTLLFSMQLWWEKALAKKSNHKGIG